MDSPRAGRWQKQLEGHRAFVPASLPPDPSVRLDAGLVGLLSTADRALGRLDGVASVLPNPNLFVAMYVRHEAVLSSQIEGTQSTLEDVLAYEADDDRGALPGDVEEVVNYVRAMNHGLARLTDLPLSSRLIREIHQTLMTGVRGGEREPGEFRTSQNWIGPAGCTLRDASFVPPPHHEVPRQMGALELFLHDREGLPPLLQIGLAHAQFETIHPFLDGNGRVGRLLITLFLCERGILARPLLYLSVYLKAHRAQYYDRLTAIRTDGDWEGWLRFFLHGVIAVSRSATETARAILRLREQTRTQALSTTAQRLVDHLFEHPVVTVRSAEGLLECTFATAGKAIAELESAGLLVETTGHKRNRRFRFAPYLSLFDRPLVGASEPEQPVTADILRTQHDGETG